MSIRTPSLPRSFLYVPTNRPELFDKAAAGAADAMVLDLEDAVPVADKPHAREAVGGWLSDRGTEPGSSGRPQCWVRLNAESIADDLDAVVGARLDGVFLAKCSPRSIEETARALGTLEPDRGLAERSIPLIGFVETAEALLNLGAMAQHARVVTFGLGEVDLLGDLRMSRTPGTSAAVDVLRTQVVLHCAAAGLQPPVAPTSTAFRDLEGFGESTRLMLDLGFRSRTAIHPGQVEVINDVFTPTEVEVEAAQDVVRRFESARGGVTTDASGHLIDAAVVREARETLDRRPSG